MAGTCIGVYEFTRVRHHVYKTSMKCCKDMVWEYFIHSVVINLIPCMYRITGMKLEGTVPNNVKPAINMCTNNINSDITVNKSKSV